MSWSKKRIKDLAIKVTKGTTPTTYGMSFTESGINYIKAGALNGFSSLLNDGFTFINERTHEKLSRSQLEENDVLVTIAGANVGSTGYVESKYLPANTNQAVGIIRLNEEKVNPKFVYYHFKKPSTKRYCLSVGGQSAQPNVNLTVLKSFELDIPNRLTQDRIVSILSAYDKLIQNNKRRIELLEKSARLLYKEWFVQLRFPGHEHTKIVDGVPEGWEKCILGNKAAVTKGKNITKKKAIDGEVPVVAGGLEPSYFHNEPNVKGPVVTVSASGANAGYVNLYHTDIWASDCSYIKSVQDSETFFLYLMLNVKQNYISAMQRGAAQPHVYPKDLKRLKVLWPSNKFKTLFEEYIEPVFLQIQKLKQSNKNLISARDLLLPKLMNGDITV